MQVITNAVNAAYTVYANEIESGRLQADLDRALDQWQTVSDEVRSILHPVALLGRELLIDAARLSGRVCGWIWGHREEIRAVFTYLIGLLALQVAVQLGSRDAADELAEEIRDAAEVVKEGAIALSRHAWRWVAPKVANAGLNFTHWIVGKVLDVREQLALAIRQGDDIWVELENAIAEMV